MHQNLDPRLFLVRRALREASQRSGEFIDYSRMSVVLGVDHAIEMLLITVLPTSGVQIKNEWPLEVLLNKLLAVEPEVAPYRDSIMRIRRLRNRVQHDGIIPSKEDAQHMLLTAESFISEVVRQVYGIGLDQITIASNLSNEKVRSRIQKAEQSIEAGDYSSALEEAAIAFEMGRRELRMGDHSSYSREFSNRLSRALSRAVEDSIDRNCYSSDDVIEFGRNLARAFQGSFDIRDAVEQLSEPLELARYGININEYIHFRSVAPHVFWRFGGSEPEAARTIGGGEPSQQDALLCVEFVATALTSLEGGIGAMTAVPTIRNGEEIS